MPLPRWEVLPRQVEFEEEIGRGAFAKVLRGIFKESPGIEVFYKCRSKTVDFKQGRTVAAKVLEGNKWLHKTSTFAPDDDIEDGMTYTT